ncbi:MAG: hypothetical protein NW226_09295 [Microscillaceae bacterium]|nr:hypothetical protein [Microscillaceae bacterium]
MGLALFFTACQKEETILPSSSQEEIITQAEAYFEKYLQKQTSEPGSTKSASHLRRRLLKEAQWNKAYTQEFSFGKGVLVPIRYGENLSGQRSSAHSFSLQEYTRLLFYKDGKGKEHLELVIAIPDETYLSDTTKAFSGDILVEDWKGNFLKGYRFYPDGHVDPLEEGSTQKREAVVSCTIIDWYTCTSYSGHAPVCRYNYTETNCTTVWGSDGGYFTIGSPSSSDYGVVHGTRSPTQIDEIILQPSFSGDALCIYKKLRNDPKFLNLLSQFEARSTWKKLYFAVEEAGGTRRGKTTPIGTTSSGYIRIVIDDDLVATGSIVEIAKTIIHEVFHAEFLGRVADLPGGWTDLDPTNFPSIYNYYNNYPGIPLAAHNHLSDVYLPILKDILMKFLPPPNSSINEQHYWALAWEGLESTDAYRASFPTTASQINQQNLAITLKNSSSKNCN